MSPVVQTLGAAFTAGTVVVASRQGQLAEIAAYSAGLGVSAFLGVVVGGGTPLVYATGGPEARQAVREVRWRAVAPALTVLAVLTAVVYVFVAPTLSFTAVLLGGLTVVLTNLAGLDATELQRNGKMALWGVSTLAGKLLPVLVVLVDGKYSVAVSAGAALTLVLNFVFARGLPRLTTDEKIPFKRVIRLSYRPSFIVISLLDVVLVRVAFVVAPLVATPVVAGAFATLLSAQTEHHGPGDERVVHDHDSSQWHRFAATCSAIPRAHGAVPRPRVDPWRGHRGSAARESTIDIRTLAGPRGPYFLGAPDGGGAL